MTKKGSKKRKGNVAGKRAKKGLGIQLIVMAESFSPKDFKMFRPAFSLFQGSENNCLCMRSNEDPAGSLSGELDNLKVSVFSGESARGDLNASLEKGEENAPVLFIDKDRIKGTVNWKSLAGKLSSTDINSRPGWVLSGSGEKAGLLAPFVIAENRIAHFAINKSEDIFDDNPVDIVSDEVLMRYPDAQLETDSFISGVIESISRPGWRKKINFLSRDAVREWKRKILPPLSIGGESPLFRLAFVSLLVVAFFGMTILSQNAGISGDEYRYLDQAERVYNYYATFGSDKAAVSQTGIDPQHYNAQTFDNFLYTVQKWVGMPADSFGFRHFWNAVLGWLAILLTGLIALRLGGGYRMAFVVCLLLLLSPRFLGHAYNNHRDIPMATAVLFAFYWMIPFLRSLPRINKKAAIWVIVGIASAFSLRLGGGVLLAGYLVFFAGIFYALRFPVKMWFASDNLAVAGKMAGYSLVLAGIGWGISLLFWPFGLEAPIRHSLEVLDATGDIGVSLRQVFEGEELFSSAMPWYYVLRYMQLTIPLIVLAGFAAGLAFVRDFTDRHNLPVILMVVAAIVLPLYYACFMTTNHYGGWRHFIFVYPFIVLFAGMGIEGLLRKMNQKIAKAGIWVVIALGLALPLRFIVQNHPYEYIYYNELIGGTGGAAGYYELDYSMISLRETSNWLIENVVEGHRGEDKLRIATNDRRASMYYFRDYLDVVEIVYTRYYEKSEADWDYATFYSSFIAPFQIRNGLWPPHEAIYYAEVDGAIVGAVIRRVSKEDYKGHQKLREGNPVEALVHFSNYLEKDPNNAEVWTAMADAYMFLELYEATISAAQTALTLLPDYGPVLELKGGALLNTGEYEAAVSAFQAVLEDMPHNYMIHYYKAAALFRMGEYHQAIDAATMSLGYNPNFQLPYRLLAECYVAIGDHASADRIMRVLEERLGE